MEQTARDIEVAVASILCLEMGKPISLYYEVSSLKPQQSSEVVIDNIYQVSS